MADLNGSGIVRQMVDNVVTNTRAVANVQVIVGSHPVHTVIIGAVTVVIAAAVTALLTITIALPVAVAVAMTVAVAIAVTLTVVFHVYGAITRARRVPSLDRATIAVSGVPIGGGRGGCGCQGKSSGGSEGESFQGTHNLGSNS